jgi:hypothetical protein
MSEDEEPRPGSSRQEYGQAQDVVHTESQHPTMEYMTSYLGPCKTKGKLKCTLCKKEISFTEKSFYNLKSHYEKLHRGEHSGFLAALSAGSKRGRVRNPSGAGFRYLNYT